MRLKARAHAAGGAAFDTRTELLSIDSTSRAHLGARLRGVCAGILRQRWTAQCAEDDNGAEDRILHDFHLQGGDAGLPAPATGTVAGCSI